MEVERHIGELYSGEDIIVEETVLAGNDVHTPVGLGVSVSLKLGDPCIGELLEEALDGEVVLGACDYARDRSDAGVVVNSAPARLEGSSSEERFCCTRAKSSAISALTKLRNRARD